MVFKTKRMKNKTGYLANGKYMVGLEDGLTSLVGDYNPSTQEFSVEKVRVNRVTEQGEVCTTYDVTKMSSYDQKRFVNAAYAGMTNDEAIFGGRARVEELAEKGIVTEYKVKKAKGTTELVDKKYLKAGAGPEGQLVYDAREAYAEKILEKHQKTLAGATSPVLFSKAVKKIVKLFCKNAKEVDKEPMTKEKAMDMAKNVINYDSAVQNLTWEQLPNYVKNGTVQNLFEYAGAATEFVGKHIRKSDKIKAMVNGKKYNPKLESKSIFSNDEAEKLTRDNFDFYAGLLPDFKPTIHRSECTGGSYTIKGQLEDIVENDGKKEVRIQAIKTNKNGAPITVYKERSKVIPTVVAGVATGIASFLAAWGLTAAVDSDHGLSGLLGIHINKEIKEKGTIDFQSWINKTHADNAKIVIGYNNGTYTLVGTDGNGTVVTTPYTIPAQYLNGSGQINKDKLNLTFFKNGITNNNTYQINLTEKMTLDDLSNAVITLKGLQNGTVNSTDMRLHGAKDCKLHGDFDGNLSRIDNATGYLNITTGYINGNGNITNLNLTNGTGIVNFNNTKIEGNMTGYLNLTQVKGADITISGGKGTKGYVNGSKAGYVYFLNGQDPVWIEGNETLELTENMTFVGKLNNCSVQGWTKLFAGNNMTVTGNGNITNFNLVNGTGKIDMNMTVHDLKGYISNFTIPRTEMKGSLDIDASKMDLLGSVNATLGGYWNGTGTFAKGNNSRPLGNLSGYATGNLEQMLNATGWGNKENITVSNISLRGQDITIGANTGYFKYNASNPLKLTLDAQNSKITYKGDLVNLNMTGKGNTTSTWNFDVKMPNPYTLAAAGITAVGALIGYSFGADRARVDGNRINRFISKKETEREIEARTAEAESYIDSKTAETKNYVTSKTAELNTNVNTKNSELLGELKLIGGNITAQLTNLESTLDMNNAPVIKKINSASESLQEPIAQPKAVSQKPATTAVEAAKPADELLDEDVEEWSEEDGAEQAADEQGKSEEGSNEVEDHKADLSKI